MRFTTLWVLLMIYGICEDYYTELSLYTFEYTYRDEQLKPDESYPLVQVWYSEESSRLQAYEAMVNHVNEFDFSIYSDR